MSRALPLASFALSLALLACGGPKADDECKDDGFACEDELTALECRPVGPIGAKRWVALPCKGDQGCRVSGNEVACDVSNDEIGDLCATTLENKGICQADAKAALVCRNGAFIKASDCSTCTISDDQVVCQP